MAKIKELHPTGAKNPYTIQDPGGDAALFTASATCHCHPGVTCSFCDQPGHCTHKCHTFKQAKTNAKANAGHSGQGRCPKNANKATEMPAASSTPPAPSASSTTTPGTSTASQNTQQMSHIRKTGSCTFRSEWL
jgi:hypothetical protein